jgi:beta-N-acetylhexosaminidase
MRMPEWWQRVIDEVRAYHVANPSNLPGAAFAAQTLRDGPLLASVGHGWSDNTICQLGSMTKPFTATGLLMALEEYARLDVEQLVCELPGMEAYRGDALKRQIRVRHLLQHTSGLPSVHPYSESGKAACNDPEGGPPSCADPELDLGPTVPWVGSPGFTNECIQVDGKCRPARTLTLDKVSGHVMQSYGISSSTLPGTQYSYSTANYIVAARIVENLTGKSLNVYLKEKLFGPLGMKDSFFIAQKTGDPALDQRMDEGVDDQQRGRIAEVAIITPDGALPPEMAPGPDNVWDKYRRGWRYVYPDGGMYSTAGDLMTYLRMLRDGGVSQSRTILSRQIVSLIVNDQGFGHTMAFGYHTQVTPYGQGAGTLEHLGNMMTYFWYDPRADDPLLGVFLSQRVTNIMVNNNMTDGMRIIFRVFVPMLAQSRQE